MTLGVTGFNLDIERLATAATHKLKKPTGSAHAGGWKGRGGEGRNPPPGGRRCRLPKVRRISGAPPSSDRDGHLPAFLGGQLQAPRGRHRELGDLADHAGQAAIFKTLFHGAQDRGLVAGLGEDHALGRQASLSQSWREEIALPQTPQHRSISARQDTGREACCGGAMKGAFSPAGHLMQRAHRQALAGQTLVDRADAERQHPTAGAACQFDKANLTSKRVKRGGGAVEGHERLTRGSIFVLLWPAESTVGATGFDAQA